MGLDAEFIMIHFNMVISRVREKLQEAEAQKWTHKEKELDNFYDQKVSDLQQIESDLEGLRAKLISRL